MTNLNSHFQQISETQTTPPLVLHSQTARLDFVKYCLSQGKRLHKSSALNNYLYEIQKTSNTPIHVISTDKLSPGDINRAKLAILFSHLSTHHYELGDLTIEPVPPADLLQKIQDINTMSDEEAADYLDKLIGEKPPGFKDMPIEAFLNHIQNIYKKEGVKFHCYLRKNFSSPLKADAINNAGSTLGYFMPTVFCQQHINSCDISTTLTMFKKVVAHFEQMQKLCFPEGYQLPLEVTEAQKKIQMLEQEFDEMLKNPEGINQENIQTLTKNYLKEIETIQTEMEKSMGKIFSPEVELYKKSHSNHTLSTITHLISTHIMPGSINIDTNPFEFHNKLKSNLTPLSDFQQQSLINHMADTFDVAAVTKNIHKQNANPDDTFTLRTSIKKLFLNGIARAQTNFIVCGHSLLMDIDRSGHLKVIEHKDAKAQSTTLSTNGLATIGIKSSRQHIDGSLKIMLNDIDKFLKKLSKELEILFNVKSRLKPDSPINPDVNSMVEKKQAEIQSYSEIGRGIRIENEMLPPGASKSSQQFKEELKTQISEPGKDEKIHDEKIEMHISPGLK